MITLLRHSRDLGLTVLTAALCSSAALAQQSMPSQEEMWRIIQEQARQLAEQRREIDAMKQAQVGPQTSQVQAAAAPIPQSPDVPVPAAASPQVQAAVQPAQGPAPVPASPAGDPEGGWWERTSIGGYGELHYEGGNRDQIDFHRFVLFFGHKFNDRIRFFSELEVEHAYSGPNRPGEVELEQAYLQFDLYRQHRLNAGLQLIPVGILNEIHEPPTFFGVERNPVETNIIPTTWREAGLGLNGFFGNSGLGYDLLVSSGLSVPLTGANAFRVRNGRTQVAAAPAKAPSMTGRLKYTGILGVELAATAHYEFDATQGAGDPVTGEDVPAWLFSAHAAANYMGFGLRALYASWSMDSVAAKATGRDLQKGYYLEPSYRFLLSDAGFDNNAGELGVFYRYSWWDNNAGLSSLGLATTQHSFGANYWPHPDVVFKLDYLWEELDSGAKTDRLNAGIGYQF